jgi:hypothetical protein
MKSHRFAATAMAALFSLAACADNPTAPPSDPSYTAIPQSFARGAAKPYTFTRFDVNAPGAFSTFPSGINADGVIVGWYSAGAGCANTPPTACVVRGFILEDGVYTTVSYRNAEGTEASITQLRGIGPSGEMVGSYRMPGEPAVNSHGFLRTPEGEFIPVNYPGHTNTIAQRILPNGTILGCYHDTDMMATMRGMLRDKDGFSDIDAFGSMHNGATPSGRTITGLFTDMDAGKPRGYVFEDGDFTPFDAPNSIATNAWDISPSGTIVGVFAAAGTSTTHGFVLEQWRVVDGSVSGTYTTITFPVSPFVNANYTDVFGINASGDIVGKYREGPTGPFHGYIATRKGE